MSVQPDVVLAACPVCGDPTVKVDHVQKCAGNMKQVVATQKTQITEYQLAIRVTDSCCGCLKSKERFKTLPRGTPGPLCESCGKEACGCL